VIAGPCHQDGGVPHDVIGACSLDCPDACSWVVTVDDTGTAVKLRGNDDHPYTRGGLCTKVNPWLDFAADPSRLLHPLRRTGPKGAGQFERISWEEALATIAARFRTIIDEDGGNAIWPFVGTGNLGYLQGSGATPRFWHAIGAAHHHLSICAISGHLGIEYTTGHTAGIDPEDVVHARTILLWGANTLTTNQHLWPFVEEARRRGARVIVIDPARHRTAERADQHVAPRVGTDTALALGLCHVIAATALDEAFLEEHTVGWPEFAASLAAYSPAAVAQICDVPADVIVALGQRIATAGPVAIKVGQGMQRHRFGGQAARAVSCIPALTGDHRRRGGGLLYGTGPAFGLNTARLSRIDLRPPERRLLVMTRLARELQRTDPPVRALFISAANPVASNPDQLSVREQLAREDLFTVVFDAYRTDTADFADIVLPSTLQTEHTEVVDSYGHLYLHWNEPAVAPPGECVSTTELMRRLATAMGCTDPALQASDLELAADLLDAPTWRHAGIGVEELRAAGWLRIPGTEPYRPFAHGFPTASGRFELASDRAERDGHGRVPHYVAPREAADDTPGTFALIASASHHAVNSVFAGIERNVVRSGEPTVTIAEPDAIANGLAGGDLVEVANARGSFVARLAVGPSARPGIAVTTKGSWTKVFVGGRSVNATTMERNSDMGAGAVYHDNRVTIRPVAAP
jgi:anaerobic selenocysteine-containing dehydrogenase